MYYQGAEAPFAENETITISVRRYEKMKRDIEKFKESQEEELRAKKAAYDYIESQGMRVVYTIAKFEAKVVTFAEAQAMIEQY